MADFVYFRLIQTYFKCKQFTKVANYGNSLTEGWTIVIFPCIGQAKITNLQNNIFSWNSWNVNFSNQRWKELWPLLRKCCFAVKLVVLLWDWLFCRENFVILPWDLIVGHRNNFCQNLIKAIFFSLIRPSPLNFNMFAVVRPTRKFWN